MHNMNIENLTEIAFPNTVTDSEKEHYRKIKGVEFKEIMKAGEMSGIAWIQIYKDGILMIEVKESVCDLYYN